MHLNELKRLSREELAKLASEHGVRVAADLASAELCAAVLAAAGAKGEIRAAGVLEVLPDGFGFLRAAEQSFAPGPDDVYVSPSQIRRFELATGDTVDGVIRAPKESERYFALLRVEAVNGEPPESARRTPWTDRPAVHPSRYLALGSSPAARLLDLAAPLGRGARCAVVGAPGSGITSLLVAVAGELIAAGESVQVALLGERPEDVAETRRALGDAAVVTAVDEPATRHVQVAEMALARARRVAERGGDAILVIDSLTRLYRAHVAAAPAGGAEAARLAAMRAFTAGRATDAGTLTIIVGVVTGPGGDEALAADLLAAATATVQLDRTLADRGLHPAIDLHHSGTRKDDRLVPADQLAARRKLRAALAAEPPEQALAQLLDRVTATGSNAELLTGSPA